MSEPEPVTVAQLIKAYLDSEAIIPTRSDKTRDHRGRRLREFAQTYGERPAMSILQRDITAWIVARRNGCRATHEQARLAPS